MLFHRHFNRKLYMTSLNYQEKVPMKLHLGCYDKEKTQNRLFLYKWEMMYYISFIIGVL